MSKETLERVFINTQSDFFSNLKRIDIHNGGETLLHPDIPGMLTIIRKIKKYLQKNTKIGLLTNAMLLDEKKSKQIVRSKAIDEMRFSVDGINPQIFEWIRSGAKWETVKKNIELFIQINNLYSEPLKTEAICIIPRNIEHKYYLHKDFYDLFSKINKVSYRHPHNWDGSVELNVDDSSYSDIAKSRNGEVCFLLERNLVVLPDGSTTVCCNDLNGRGVIGSIWKNSLEEISNSDMRRKMISLFREGKKNSIELCKDCTGFYTHPGSNT